jgi:hypothetical protein
MDAASGARSAPLAGFFRDGAADEPARKAEMSTSNAMAMPLDFNKGPPPGVY